ncbi:hypothetical protein EGM51_12200 [Verrucomicrobia bacterium S94]|nr:hypothetical protein EGM51_12200 [Verrucomicrobia bacterium S94]
MIYPAAAVSKNQSAVTFLNFLKSDEAKGILKSHGFIEAAE